MSTVAYYKISEIDDPMNVQRAELAKIRRIDKAFSDHQVFSKTPARKRPGLLALFNSIRSGDVVLVSSLDRLGKDAIDILRSIEFLLSRDISIEIPKIGEISTRSGALVFKTLAQMAAIERRVIFERTKSGRETARRTLRRTGATHNGKASMGRPKAVDHKLVKEWRRENEASIAKTAEHFGVSPATVKRCMRV